MIHEPQNLARSDDESTWECHPEVLSCSQADTTALLSLVDNHYFSLNATGSTIWEMLTGGHSIDTITASLSDVFEISNEQAGHDVREFVEELRTRGFVRQGAAPTRCGGTPGIAPSNPALLPGAISPPTELPSICHCVWLLSKVTVMLRFFGFKEPLRSALEVPPASLHHRAPIPLEQRRELTRRVRLAAAWLPFSAACLPQSLTLILLLRRMGIRAYLRVGVHPFPFSAHAWVECAGEPVNETAEGLMRYRVMSPPASGVH